MFETFTSNICFEPHGGIITFGRNGEISSMKLVLGFEPHSRRLYTLLESFEHRESLKSFYNLSSLFVIFRVFFMVQRSRGLKYAFSDFGIFSIDCGLKFFLLIKVIGF